MVHLTGFDSYCYYKWDTGFTSSTTMGANTAANMHLGFNPIVGEFTPPGVKLGEEEETFFSDKETSLAYSTYYEPEDTENTAVFRDPVFMLNAVFDHATVPATWAGSTNTVTGDFTSTSHVTYLVVQDHVHDQSGAGNDLDQVYYGVRVVDYAWILEKGKLLKEWWKWNARGFANTALACDMTAGFDDAKFDRTGVDGGFSNWDGSATNGWAFHQCSYTVAGAALSHVNVEKVKLGCRIQTEYLTNQTSREAFDVCLGTRKYYCEVEGFVSGPNQYTELKNTISSRTRRTHKIQYQTNKYLQFTNGVLKSIDKAGIPKAGEPLKIKLIYEGVQASAGTLPTMSFSWLGSEDTDPSNAIFHT